MPTKQNTSIDFRQDKAIASKATSTHYSVGEALSPAFDDPCFVSERDALECATENSWDKVVCVWNSQSETMWLVYCGECFKRLF